MADERETSFAESVERSRTFVAKATFLGGEDQASNVMANVDEAERAFNMHGAIDPPYNPLVLVSLYEMSNSLRQNVDAYVTNIDGFGHTFKPVLDLDLPDAKQRIAQAIYLERLRAVPAGQAPEPGALAPSEADVEARKTELVEAMRLEKVRLEHFFEFCCDDVSFISFRRRLRQDLETLGNAYYEVLRDQQGAITQFTYVPAFTVRLRPLDKTPTEVKARVRVSDLDYTEVTKRKVFRTYVQVFEQRAVVFKEFGDPRKVSRKGRMLGPNDTFDEDDGPATELVHIKLHSPRSAYGVPRWIGNLLSVFGSRQAEEVNHSYFENKSVPPLAVLVSGGRMTEESVKRLESYIEHNLKGKKNFHKILILEAEPSGASDMSIPNPGRMTVDLKPLTDAQQKDALFQGYDERNIDKVGMAFRLPRLLRGDIRDFNRASAEASLEFAEQQVFAPERQEFDWAINRRILADMGVRFWKFESNTPTSKDPSVLAEIIVKLMQGNVLTPAEARELSQPIFNTELPNIDAPWTKQPIALTLAGVPLAPEEEAPYTGEEAGAGQDRAGFDEPEGDVEPGAGPQVPAGAPGAQDGAAAGPGGAVRRAFGRTQGRAAGGFARQAADLVALRNVLLEVEARAAQRLFDTVAAGDGRAAAE